MFRDAPKAVRRDMRSLDKHPKQRLMHMKEIPRPKYVTLTNGQRVKYEGP
jgi:hypothetical protein